MKIMLLTLTALSLTMALTGCKSAKDMVTATSEPMSTASATPTTNLANSFMNFIFISLPNCLYALSEFIFSPSVPT